MNTLRGFLVAAFLGWSVALGFSGEELSRVWTDPSSSVEERAAVVNRTFTNGTPVSAIVAALGTNYTHCFSSARVWLGQGPEPRNTAWLGYNFGEESVFIFTTAGIDENILTGMFTSAGYTISAAGTSQSKPMLSFSLTATNASFSRQLSPDLLLRAERDVLGWEVGVFLRTNADNLLYPQPIWHGAFPCQLSAWSHRTRTFPDKRVIPIRGYRSSVRIRLVDVKVAGESGNEKFIGGRVEIFWTSDA